MQTTGVIVVSFVNRLRADVGVEQLADVKVPAVADLKKEAFMMIGGAGAVSDLVLVAAVGRHAWTTAVAKTVGATASAKAKFQSGPVVHSQNRHGSLWVGRVGPRPSDAVAQPAHCAG